MPSIACRGGLLSTNMQIYSNSTPKPRSPLSILLIGPPGGGKSTLAMQFPFPCFLDVDRNLDGPNLYLKSRISTLEYGYVNVTYDKDGKPLPSHQVFDNLIDQLKLIKKEPSVKTIVIDGLTLINEYIIQKVLKSQGSKLYMETQYWGQFKSELVRLVYNEIRETDKTTILTCHEDPIEKQDPKTPMLKTVIGYRPCVNSGIRDQFGGLFTDMWRCTVQSVPPVGNFEYHITPIKDPMCELKNSVGMDSEIIIKKGELAWDKLKKYLEGKI